MVDVLVCGVGGQGVLLLAEVLGTAALKSGLDVRVSEIHGMAQRGGSVVCHVRVGPRPVHAPTIMDGDADVLLALEPVEALRTLRFASRKTVALVSTRKIVPVMASLGMASYPPVERIMEELRKAIREVITVDALSLAEEAGSPIAQNMVMAGALYATGLLPIGREALLSAIRQLVPRRYVDINIRAFELGEEAVRARGTKSA